MPQQVFSNGIILAGKDLERVEGYLIVQDNQIKEIGEGQPPKRGIDLHKGFIIPSFINSHTHLADSVRKDIYIGKSQAEVVGVGGEKFSVLESSSRESKIKAIKSSIRDMTRTGTVAHCDFRESGKDGVRLLKEASESAVKSIILSRPKNSDETKDLLEISDGIGLPSLESFPPSEMKKISAQASKSGKIFSIHAAETKEAQESSIKNTGKTEIRRSLEFDPTFLTHGAWASDEDLTLLSKGGVPLVVCGRSNHLLSAGTPPISRAMEEGVEIWIGTDNATVCQPNMFRELSFDWTLLRKDNPRAGSEEARTLLKAATINPSEGLGLSFGVIEEGSKAVFTVLGRRENLRNLKNSYVGIVSRARVDNIRMVSCPDGELRKFYK